MLYLCILISVLLICAFVWILFRTRKRSNTQIAPFSTELHFCKLLFAGIGIAVLLFLGAAVSAVLLFLFLLFLLLFGAAYVLLTLAQKRDTSYCARGLQTLAKQGGQFFMTLFALFVEFVLNFVGVA